MDGDETAAPPARVSLAPSSPAAAPSPRLLYRSSALAFPVARKQLPWTCIRDPPVVARETAVPRIAGGDLGSEEEAVAGEPLSPLCRLLAVAVAAVADAESRRSSKISQLQRSVDVREQVLLSMQQKLDNLCGQMNLAQDQCSCCTCKSLPLGYRFVDQDRLAQVVEQWNCWHRIMEMNPESCVAPFHRDSSNRPKNAYGVESDSGEMFRITHVPNQKKQQLSDMSDLCSKSRVASSNIQLSTLALEQELYNLQTECEEKDAAIKKLDAAANVSSVADSVRMMELEDIIRRKDMIITKLKKDMAVLEQKCAQWIRLQTPCSCTSNSNKLCLPVMMSNPLYDMSNTSPSSSDSDSPNEQSENNSQDSVSIAPRQQSILAMENKTQVSGKSPISLNRVTYRLSKQRPLSPLEENCMIHRESFQMSRPRQLGSSGCDKRLKRDALLESKSVFPPKRWA